MSGIPTHPSDEGYELTLAIRVIENSGKYVINSKDWKLLQSINSPETKDFDSGVLSEFAHQEKRWGTENDSGKTPEDWFWLVGYLAGKALHYSKSGDISKALHHCISTAAVMRNWHKHILGAGTMQPGLSDPKI